MFLVLKGSKVQLTWTIHLYYGKTFGWSIHIQEKDLEERERYKTCKIFLKKCCFHRMTFLSKH